MSDDDAPDSDVGLLRDFRAGERDAFGSLSEKHRPMLRGVVRRYLKDDALAEDIVQQALLHAIEHLDGFRGESRFRSWLARIAVNLALNHLRRRPAEPLSTIEDDVAFAVSLETSKLVAAEVWRKIVAQLDELPPRQRIVVELRLFHEMTFEEIAVIVDSSAESAKANFYHAAKRLRGRIELGTDR